MLTWRGVGVENGDDGFDVAERAPDGVVTTVDDNGADEDHYLDERTTTFLGWEDETRLFPKRGVWTIVSNPVKSQESL